MLVFSGIARALWQARIAWTDAGSANPCPARWARIARPIHPIGTHRLLCDADDGVRADLLGRGPADVPRVAAIRSERDDGATASQVAPAAAGGRRRRIPGAQCREGQ
jgi:hypothetical protein